jgi:hypothetical protein
VRSFSQSIQIAAPPSAVERCFTQLKTMHRWLNPVLRVQPQEIWSTELGSSCEFLLQLPLIQPRLHCQVFERDQGLIVWAFKGFFTGYDTWRWYPNEGGCQLENCFQFEIPNPLVQVGFDLFAARLTQVDMRRQLERLKQVAEADA